MRVERLCSLQVFRNSPVLTISQTLPAMPILPFGLGPQPRHPFQGGQAATARAIAKPGPVESAHRDRGSARVFPQPLRPVKTFHEFPGPPPPARADSADSRPKSGEFNGFGNEEYPDCSSAGGVLRVCLQCESPPLLQSRQGCGPIDAEGQVAPPRTELTSSCAPLVTYRPLPCRTLLASSSAAGKEPACFP
jgi:hypothetical protein